MNEHKKAYRKLTKEYCLDNNPDAGDNCKEVTVPYPIWRKGDFKAEMENKVFRKIVGRWWNR